jgi:hypothetical protein
MDLKWLRKVALEESNGLPNNFRCHEVARKIGNRLRLLGVNVDVKDGLVEYDTSSLVMDFLSSMDFFDNLSEEMKSELAGKNIKKKIQVFHSWCEVADGSGDIVVVDWHACLKLSRDESLEKILIVERKSSLPHNYSSVGIVVGKWIILKKFPPYATRLRI